MQEMSPSTRQVIINRKGINMALSPLMTCNVMRRAVLSRFTAIRHNIVYPTTPIAVPSVRTRLTIFDCKRKNQLLQTQVDVFLMSEENEQGIVSPGLVLIATDQEKQIFLVRENKAVVLRDGTNSMSSVIVHEMFADDWYEFIQNTKDNNESSKGFVQRTKTNLANDQFIHSYCATSCLFLLDTQLICGQPIVS